MEHSRSKELFELSKKYIPGGVNSPVRAFRAVGCDPVFIDHGKGDRVFDVDGNEYIDYVTSWGPLILGHANEMVLDAVKRCLPWVVIALIALRTLSVKTHKNG